MLRCQGVQNAFRLRVNEDHIGLALVLVLGNDDRGKALKLFIGTLVVEWFGHLLRSVACAAAFGIRVHVEQIKQTFFYNQSSSKSKAAG